MTFIACYQRLVDKVFCIKPKGRRLMLFLIFILIREELSISKPITLLIIYDKDPKLYKLQFD